MGKSGLLNHITKKALENKDLCIQRESITFTFLDRWIPKGKWEGPSKACPGVAPTLTNQVILILSTLLGEVRPRVLTLIDTLHVETLSQGKEHPLSPNITDLQTFL